MRLLRRRPRAQAGQSMIEYVVILSFGVMVLLGPGGSVLEEAVDVLRENQRGYAFSMSMSPLPDYDRVVDYRTGLQGTARGKAYRPEAVERLAVGGAALQTELMHYAGRYSQLKSGLELAKNLTDDLSGRAENWAADAVNLESIDPTNGLASEAIESNLSNPLCGTGVCPQPPTLPPLPRYPPLH